MKRYGWLHGVAFLAGIHGLSMALRAATRKPNTKKDAHQENLEIYNNERLPAFAPPAIAFPIAWGINSVASMAGTLRVLNMPKETEGRGKFLALQGAAWAVFAGFDAAYFGLKSPINAGALTFLYSAFTTASIATALRRLHDKPTALSLAPTAAWLALANPLGLSQAAWNYDSFWKVGPLAEPNKKWLKEPA